MQAKKAADELIQESEGLIEQAREVTKEMESLSDTDPTKKKLEEFAEKLLERSVRISKTAKKMLK